MTQSGSRVGVVVTPVDNPGMAYGQELASRIREAVADEGEVTEKRMFGGLAFLVNGHLAITASRRGGVMARVDPAQTDALIDPPHVGRTVMRGREMDGWLSIDAEVVDGDEQLRHWVRLGVDYARTLPRR